MLNSNARKHAANAAIDQAIQAALRSVTGQHFPIRSTFERLLRLVRRRTLLLSPERGGGRMNLWGHCEMVESLLALAGHHQAWLRDLEAWEPAEGSPLPQFSSLARHLLAAYPVPAFMTSVWSKGQTAEAWRQQDWFIHIGMGRNIRKADLPLPYTKMMAHHFLQAPDHLTVEEALRWGQVRGMGGSKALALAVIRTRLGRSFESEDFWGTVVQFFVNHPELNLDQVAPVVQFLHQQRFVPETELIEEGELLSLDPPQPDFSMKGRTPRSLLRQIAEWREQLKCPKKRRTLKWKHSGIQGFRHVERDTPETMRCWTIRELTTAKELSREGEAMRHCVATYATACARRRTSIWSLRFENSERRFRVMTIEVDLTTRTICQARRRGNSSPNAKALRVMRLWAEQAGLKLEFWCQGVLMRE